MPIAARDMGDVINTLILISLVVLKCFTTFHSSFSQANTTSPFSKSNVKIQNISVYTSDGKYFVNLQYAQTLVGKGKTMFFMVNLFDLTQVF
jgi:hypothetical protein